MLTDYVYRCRLLVRQDGENINHYLTLVLVQFVLIVCSMKAKLNTLLVPSNSSVSGVGTLSILAEIVAITSFVACMTFTENELITEPLVNQPQIFYLMALNLIYVPKKTVIENVGVLTPNLKTKIK